MDGNLLSSAVYEVLVLASPQSSATTSSPRPLTSGSNIPGLSGPVFQLLSPAGVGISYRSMPDDSSRSPNTPVKDSSVVEVVKEAPKEAVKEIAKEIAKDVIKDVAKEAPKETVKEVAKDITKEAAKDGTTREPASRETVPSKEAAPKEPSHSKDSQASTSAPVAPTKEVPTPSSTPSF